MQSTAEKQSERENQKRPEAFNKRGSKDSNNNDYRPSRGRRDDYKSGDRPQRGRDGYEPRISRGGRGRGRGAQRASYEDNSKQEGVEGSD